MKTDTLFYRLFHRRPGLAMELLGLAHSGAGYRFGSEEIKQTALRIDGIFTPPTDRPDLPLIFTEVQYQPVDDLYDRLFTEICLYLRYKKPLHPWLALVIHPDRSAEKPVNVAFKPFTELPQLHRIYLQDYLDKPGQTLSMELIRMIAGNETQTVELACRLVTQPNRLDADGLDFIETILVYKLPHLSREEIRAMLALNDIELKQTRFYQEIAQEERQEGRQEGEARLLKCLLVKRFGLLPEWVTEKLTQAKPEQLEQWGERILEAKTLAEVFQ